MSVEQSANPVEHGEAHPRPYKQVVAIIESLPKLQIASKELSRTERNRNRYHLQSRWISFVAMSETPKCQMNEPVSDSWAEPE